MGGHLKKIVCHSNLVFFLLNECLLQEANKGPDGWFELKINTHVYVTGLPEDVTIDEVCFRSVLRVVSSTIVFIV